MIENYILDCINKIQNDEIKECIEIVYSLKERNTKQEKYFVQNKNDFCGLSHGGFN